MKTGECLTQGLFNQPADLAKNYTVFKCRGSLVRVVKTIYRCGDFLCFLWSDMRSVGKKSPSDRSAVSFPRQQLVIESSGLMLKANLCDCAFWQRPVERPYFHYCLSNVRNCEDRIYIHFFIRSSHIRFSYIYSQLFITSQVYFGPTYNDQLPVGWLAQLVEHCTGIAEVMDSNPIQA